MTTPILLITELADGQVDQFATANEAWRSMEAAGNDFTTVSLASSDVTLTAAQFAADFLFVSSGNAVSRTLTIPAAKRFFAVYNGGSAALNVTRGSTTISVDVGDCVLLYSDGTTNGLLNAASGVGGLNNLVEAVSTASPNATVPVASLTATNAATNVGAALAPKGSGELTADVPDSTSAGGNKRGAYSTDWQRSRSSASQVASGDGATIGGGYNNTASNTRDTVTGGESNAASGTYSSVGGGYTNAASGAYSAIVGGRNNTASGQYSEAGGYYATARGIQGAMARACGVFATPGDAQICRFVARVATTNATATAVTTTGGAAGATNQPIMPNNHAYLFTARVVGRSSADAAAYQITGLIRRGANAASTAIEGTPTVTVIAESSGATAWDVAAVADTTNGGLQIQVTGAAATNINWVADIETLEVG